MSIFSASASLASPPEVYYGFWYSYGSNQSRGYMLTLSNFIASSLPTAVGLLGGWAVSRLWRICCTVLFYLSYADDPSWEESQNNVFIVNSKDPLGGSLDSAAILTSRAKVYRRHVGGRFLWSKGDNRPSYTRARKVMIAVMLVGVTATALKISLPPLIALIPVTKQGIAVPNGCGGLSPPGNSTQLANMGEVSVKQGRLANAAFATLDRTQPVGVSSETGYTTLPEVEKSFNLSCPTDMPACSKRHPFTFSSQYTLSNRHFGLNIDTSFSLRVSDSCFRLRSTLSRVGPADVANLTDSPTPANFTEYGYYYGPVTGLGGLVWNVTILYNEEQAKAASYAIERARALANASEPAGWSPYRILTRGGDTTLLLYYIGGILMTNQSSDPIFATGGEVLKFPFFPLYHAKDDSIPIICDTKYVFCDTNRNDCSSPGGAHTLLNWLEDKQGTTWADIRQLLNVSLNYPPIHVAALGSAATLAAQTAARRIQYAPGNISTFGELGRLSTAGMVMLASYAQLSAVGYWGNTTSAARLTTESNPDSLCNRVLVESSTATTIPVIPYFIFFLLSALIISVSYSGPYLSKKSQSQSLNRLVTTWARHQPGQLLYRLTEALKGKDFKAPSTTRSWPNMPYQDGPVIAPSRRGVEHFVSGKPGSLTNDPTRSGYYPLHNRT